MAKILIIDDNHYIRFTLTAVIEEYGFNAITAESCDEGLKEIVSENPSVIILDKKLPDGDGIELLKKIKNLDDHKNIPVIMLTAYANEISSEEALKLGAVAFFTKPFDNDEIISTIKKVL
jgi:DNA-binding response OmpR family regulator